jgi:hypothetical protein
MRLVPFPLLSKKGKTIPACVGGIDGSKREEGNHPTTQCLRRGSWNLLHDFQFTVPMGVLSRQTPYYYLALRPWRDPNNTLGPDWFRKLARSTEFK